MSSLNSMDTGVSVIVFLIVLIICAYVLGGWVKDAHHEENCAHYGKTKIGLSYYACVKTEESK